MVKVIRFLVGILKCLFFGEVREEFFKIEKEVKAEIVKVIDEIEPVKPHIPVVPAVPVAPVPPTVV